jgi:hypothetical protein
MDTNPKENAAQSQSDATPDAVADVRETPERGEKTGSDANGIPAFDEADGEQRKKLYEETGSPIVSRLD